MLPYSIDYYEEKLKFLTFLYNLNDITSIGGVGYFQDVLHWHMPFCIYIERMCKYLKFGSYPIDEGLPKGFILV